MESLKDEDVHVKGRIRTVIIYIYIYIYTDINIHT